jgi:3-dehydroquinate dehydratase type I
VSSYEVRIDLIGPEWPRVASGLARPWIACDRIVGEGGSCDQPEAERLRVLERAVELGASLVDVELAANGVETFVSGIKASARVIVSHHDLRSTGTEEELVALVERERAAGADICKVVTTATRASDNVVVLNVAKRFAGQPVVTFAMGPLGIVSRVLAPLAGAAFTYASLASGHESAPGQLTVTELHGIYQTLGARARAHLR